MCCETYNLFRKFGIYYELAPSTFVITPEGKLKALWCHLRSHNCHMKYF
jgi:peroxiredoxin